jgi:hypothetical protein
MGRNVRALCGGADWDIRRKQDVEAISECHFAIREEEQIGEKPKTSTENMIRKRERSSNVNLRSIIHKNEVKYVDTVNYSLLPSQVYSKSFGKMKDPDSSCPIRICWNKEQLDMWVPLLSLFYLHALTPAKPRKRVCPPRRSERMQVPGECFACVHSHEYVRRCRHVRVLFLVCVPASRGHTFALPPLGQGRCT